MYVIRTWSPLTFANSESNQTGITYLTKDLKIILQNSGASRGNTNVCPSRDELYT